MIEIIAAIYTGTDFAVGGADPEARKTEHGAVDHFSSGNIAGPFALLQQKEGSGAAVVEW